MTESVQILVQEQSQIAEARRNARRMAHDIGFDEIRGEEVAIAVTEACTNLLKYAGGGEVLLRVTEWEGTADSQAFEVLAIDRGPGMADPEQCKQNGFTTGTSPGQGLGAIARLANQSDLHSRVGKGTVVLARWAAAAIPGQRPAVAVFPESSVRVGAVNVPKTGQEVCGDSWAVERSGDCITLLIADGLGHGYEASLASRDAVRVFRENPGLSPIAVIEFCHAALRSSRGAAISVARIDRARQTVTFCGVGNVSAQIYSGVEPRQHLVTVNGTAGHQIQRLREFHYPWPPNGMLLMHSDGLSTATGFEGQPALALRDPSLIAGVLYRDFARGHDDATVVVLKAA